MAVASPFYVPYDKITPLVNARGERFICLWQAFPWLKRLYTKYEMEYDRVPYMQDYLAEHGLYWPLYVVAAYALVILGGRRLMRDRPPFDLKKPLAAWNLFLALFSWAGVFRTVPYLLYWLSHMSLEEMECTMPVFTHGDRDIGFWVMLFTASKVFELIDTVFIVLRKKPLIFLHWYHHVTVLLFTTYSSMYRHGGLFFVAMNFTVHAVMYAYFALMALNLVPKGFNPLWITMAQISQMFAGVGVTIAATYYKSRLGDACPGQRWPLLYGGMAMYGSYLYLFLQFAFKRFVLAPQERASKRGGKTPAAAAESSEAASQKKKKKQKPQ